MWKVYCVYNSLMFCLTAIPNPVEDVQRALGLQ